MTDEFEADADDGDGVTSPDGPAGDSSQAPAAGRSGSVADDAESGGADASDAGTDARVGAGGPTAARADETAGDDLVDDEVVDPASIDAAELTLSERSLHPRIRVLWALRAALIALIAGVLAGVTAYTFDFGLVVPAAVGLGLLVLGVTFAVLRYRVWRYAVREDALYLERGVITRVRTVVPLVRIQHVDTRRGPVERLTGLSTVVVYTAGSRGADVSIPGVSAERADDLQRRLKRLAIASEADTSV